DQVIQNLWLGNIASIADVENLKKNNIHSILSAMRGRVVVQGTFTHKQIEIDDDEEEDILNHLVASTSFIGAELEKGRSVLVHCQGGIGRSATIVAAYLMYSHQLDTDGALKLIRQSRPYIDPNPGFLEQLDVFHRASYKVSRNDKATRMFYLERAVHEVMNGDGSELETKMFAKFPRSPSDSTPSTPAPVPRRRIRCKACRQELAAREHMLDHGQLGPPTPAFTPAESRRPSMNDVKSRRPSIPDQLGSDLGKLSMSRRGSSRGSFSDTKAKLLGLDGFASLGRGMSESLSMSALEIEEEPEIEKAPGSPSISGLAHPSSISAQLYANPKLAALRTPGLPASTTASPTFASVPPILVDSRCSGYFVEAMKWMEPFLGDGKMAGRIICPNKKCGAKLGNYDWAGVRCSCKAWVVPGFCIHRSKVDEMVV
ncbi:phosphatases II, partial [Thelephora ganbajun]